jgi:hypothetical protein
MQSFTFEGEAVLALLAPEDEGNISFLSKHQEPFTHQHCVTSQRFQLLYMKQVLCFYMIYCPFIDCILLTDLVI